ncbi:putative leucine-rich repeat-containing protein DDB_G0290503 [Onthophagus taurus]|uniref:putative leucine-rich repeat-containing protein DDB_G0290503 n=1 Tax=Onthophagus taurus TaxID=166361 RepID=UPI0039BDF1FC
MRWPLFSLALIVMTSIILPAKSDITADIKNVRDDLKFVIDNIQQLIILQNKRISTSLVSVKSKLNTFEIDQDAILLLSNETLQECGSQNKNFMANFNQILTKVDNIDYIKNDVKSIEISNQKQLDEVKTVQNTIQNVLTRLTGIENSLTNTIQQHSDKQNRKITDFENKMANSLKEIKNQHQNHMDNLKEVEDNTKKLLNQLINLDKLDINLSIQQINKALLDNENNQKNKFDKLAFKITGIEADQKVNNNLNQQNSVKINNMELNLSDIKNEMYDIKSKNVDGKQQILNALSVQIGDVKKEVTAQNSNVPNAKTIESSLKTIEDKLVSSEASLTNRITTTGQSLQNAMNTVQGKIYDIQQNSPTNTRINEIYRIADYLKRVACNNNPWVAPYCNKQYF